jgi:hypothetical protein
VIQKDLARALALPAREVCMERTGDQCAAGGIVTLKDWIRAQNVPEPEVEAECRRMQRSSVCVDGPYIPLDNPRGIHVISLGGNNPFMGGLLDVLPEPIVITPIALERVALAACGERVARDASGTPVVFRHVDLAAPTVDATSPGVSATLDEMYKRLLARLPSAAEREGALSLLSGPPISGAELARLTCFLVATLPEFAFQ